MKSEPDRLDLLVVLLPLALLVVLGVQAYHFYESREGRAAGAELALQVEELAATKIQLGPPTQPAAAAPAATPENASEPAAANDEIPIPDDGTAAPAGSDAMVPMTAATTGEGSVAPAPAIADPGAVATTPPAVPSRPPPPPPQARGGTAGQPESSAAANPSARAARQGSGAGGTVVGGAVADPPSTPGDEPPSAKSGSSRGGSGAPQPEDPARAEPRLPARVTAAPQAAEVGVGQVIPVEIQITNGANVASVPFHLKFDPKVVKLNATPRSERGPFLTQDGNDPQFLVATGPAGDEVIVGLSLLGASAGASGDGMLCTIYFLAVAPGTSPLQFTHASVRGPDARMLPATFLPAAIKVNG